MVVFQSAWALWGLLGVPLLVAIHFFRRRAKRVEVSTFFLLKERERVTQRGAVWTRFEGSWPFLFQVLAVILAALFCAQPAWLRDEAELRIAFVLDDSVSMQAFQAEAIDAVAGLLNKTPRAITLDAGVFSSFQKRRNLGFYEDSGKLIEALKNEWAPSAGLHEPANQIEQARRWAGDSGYVVWLSDADTFISGVDVSIAVGKPLPNVGITGIHYTEGGRWEARVTNFSDQPASRQWWLKHATGTTDAHQLSIAPGQSVRISGRAVEGLERPYLELSEDALAVDNIAFLLAPEIDPLKIAVTLDEKNKAVWGELANGLQGWTREVPRAQAHVQITDQPAEVRRSSIQFLPSDSAQLAEAWSRGPYLREEHPLAQGLTLGGFLARFGISDTTPDQAVLFRQANTPVVWQPEGYPMQLHFEFAPAFSNLSQHPGALLLIDRFLRSEQMRFNLIRAENYIYGEPLTVARAEPGWLLRQWQTGDALPVEKSLTPGQRVFAPNATSVFEILDTAGRTMHQGTSQFFEASELDLRNRITNTYEIPQWVDRLESELRPVPGVDLIPALIIGLLLGAWWMIHRSERPRDGGHV